MTAENPMALRTATVVHKEVLSCPCPLHCSGRSFARKFSFSLLNVRQRSSRKRPQSRLQSGKWAEVDRAEVAARLRTQ
jgi:hypothetical protein